MVRASPRIRNSSVIVLSRERRRFAGVTHCSCAYRIPDECLRTCRGNRRRHPSRWRGLRQSHCGLLHPGLQATCPRSHCVRCSSSLDRVLLYMLVPSEAQESRQGPGGQPAGLAPFANPVRACQANIVFLYPGHHRDRLPLRGH